MTEYNFRTTFPNGVSVEKLVYEGAVVIQVANGVITLEGEGLATIIENHIPNVAPWSNVYDRPTGTLTHITGILPDLISLQMDDFLYATFSIVPNNTTITNLLASYVEPPTQINVPIYQTTGTQFLTTGSQILRTIMPQELVVSPTSSKYTSIGAALADVSGATKISVFPGTYYESNPLVLPANCTIVGEGNAGNTIVIGVNASPVIITHDFCTIRSITIVGGTTGVQYDCTNTSAFTVLQDTVCTSPVGLYAYGGRGSILVQNLVLSGSTGIRIVGGSVIGSLIIYQPAGGGTTKAVDLSGGGIFNCIVISIYSATYGFYVQDSDFSAVYAKIYNCDTGVYVAATQNASTPDVNLTFLLISGCNTDLNIQTETNLKLFTSSLNEDKIINNSTTTIGGFIQDFYGNNYQMLLGDVYVGTDTIPANMTIGTTFDTMVLPDPNGEFYTTEEGSSPSPVARTYVRNTAKFWGLTTAATLAGPVEYWNGSAWASMSIYSINNKRISGKIESVFVETFFDYDSVMASTTINAVEGYWCRIVGTQTGSITIHPHGTFFNSKGVRTLMGRARLMASMHLHMTTSPVSWFVPPNMDLSSAYTVRMAADNVADINGTSFNTPVAEKKIYPTAGLQSFTYTATNVQCIDVTYHTIY